MVRFTSFQYAPSGKHSFDVDGLCITDDHDPTSIDPLAFSETSISSSNTKSSKNATNEIFNLKPTSAKRTLSIRESDDTYLHIDREIIKRQRVHEAGHHSNTETGSRTEKEESFTADGDGDSQNTLVNISSRRDGDSISNSSSFDSRQQVSLADPRNILGQPEHTPSKKSNIKSSKVMLETIFKKDPEHTTNNINYTHAPGHSESQVLKVLNHYKLQVSHTLDLRTLNRRNSQESRLPTLPSYSRKLGHSSRTATQSQEEMSLTLAPPTVSPLPLSIRSSVPMPCAFSTPRTRNSPEDEAKTDDSEAIKTHEAFWKRTREKLATGAKYEDRLDQVHGLTHLPLVLKLEDIVRNRLGVGGGRLFVRGDEYFGEPFGYMLLR
ncbi:hypothetical protein H0H93_010933 [Arthromyces matolae]|nr:hypothetical protein H0H93_010933 [Arthromyces matolae]